MTRHPITKGLLQGAVAGYILYNLLAHELWKTSLLAIGVMLGWAQYTMWNLSCDLYLSWIRLEAAVRQLDDALPDSLKIARRLPMERRPWFYNWWLVHIHRERL